MKKINLNKLFIFVITIITLLLLFYFLKNIIFEIIKCYISNDNQGAARVLEESGWFGYLAVVLVEGLQMVVVFISAEFIQISAGISYPWYIAVPLCSAGIFLGATLIYLLCNMTKFDSSIFKKSEGTIKSFAKKSKNVQLLMYILFISPIIPFGAICYFGSQSKITYKRYILTCLTATIPSILTSIFLGKVISFAIVEEIPAWIVILSIVAVMAILLAACAVIIDRTILKEDKNTPDSIFYNVLLKIYKFLVKRKIKYTKDDFESLNLDEPFVILSNHPSDYDMYYITDLVYPKRLTFVVNYYYFKNRIFRYLLKSIGVAPKKLFTPDMKTIKATIKSIKNGYPVFMCPEGRLGLDGTNYYITKETGKFVKQLKVPIVIANINGAYVSKPKWRKHRIKSHVETKIARVITKEEVLNLSVEEINDIINKNIAYNEYDYIKEKGLVFKDKHKAEGLENVLYYCPKCHKEYTITTKNNQVKCNHCGLELNIKDDYHFEENELKINTIHDYYQIIVKYEKENIEKGINLNCDVIVKKFNIENKKLNEKGSGTCTLTNEGFRYEGDLEVKEFFIDIKVLRALAFSCGVEFECYYNNELYYFYPVSNRAQCAKWALIVDELVKGVEEDEE